MSVKTVTSTKEMQVTSIRFERSLIEKLKQMAGPQGYQSLVREVLWDYVNHRSPSSADQTLDPQKIRAVMPAQSCRPESCALTGDPIPADEEMWLGLTEDNHLVPIGFTNLDV